MTDLRHVTVNGARMAYREAGSGPAIVFIHGHGYESSSWEDQIAHLRDRYRVIAYDVRGFGASEVAQAGYSMAGFARDLIGLLDALGIDRAVVAGLSMGGMILMQAALDAPDRLAGIILCDTAASDGTWPAEPLVARMGTAVDTGYAPMAASAGNAFYGERFRAARPGFDAWWRERYLKNHPYPMIAASLAMAVRGNTLADLPRISVPTLVIVGEHDRVAPLAAAETITNAIPGARLAVIADCGHLANEEEPEQFNALVDGFLKEIRW